MPAGVCEGISLVGVKFELGVIERIWDLLGSEGR